MNKCEAVKLKTETKERPVDAVSVTASHSFESKPRPEVWTALRNAPVYHLNRRTERRGIGFVRVDGIECHIEFQVESTANAGHNQDKLPEERSKMVDSLRIKVKKDLTTENDAENAIRQCQKGLQRIEQAIEWLEDEDPLSLTYYYQFERGKGGVEQKYLQDITIVLFDGKLRVRRVARDDVDQALYQVAEYRASRA